MSKHVVRILILKVGPMIKQNILDENTTLVWCIVQKQLMKPRSYHPTLIREFSPKELELIFGFSKDIADFEQEIEIIEQFIVAHSITCVKEVMKLCRMMVPSHTCGMYHGRFGIEISTDLEQNKLLIEINDERKTISKKELIKIFSRNQ